MMRAIHFDHGRRLTSRPWLLGLIILAGLAALVGAGLSAAGGRDVRLVAAPNPSQLAQLKTIAEAAADRAGDPHPTNGFVVPTTRKAVNALNGGAEVETDENVFAVSLHGNFVAQYAHVPPGAALPTGHLMILVVDANTMQTIDFILGNSVIDTTQLGTPVALGL